MKGFSPSENLQTEPIGFLFFSSSSLTGNVSTSGAWASVECFPLVLSQARQIQPVYGYFNSPWDYITHLEVAARANIKRGHVSAASREPLSPTSRLL